MSFLTLKSIYLEDIMEAESTGIGICGWILTLLSLVLVLVTVPFSLFVCFKVNLLISFFLFWGCPRYIYLTLLNTGFIYHIYFVCLSVSYKRQNGWTVWQLTWPQGRFMIGKKLNIPSVVYRYSKMEAVSSVCLK